MNHYALSNKGCEACNCNPHGSIALQCSNSGGCPCVASAEGMKCDICKAGFFGLPANPCKGIFMITITF